MNMWHASVASTVLVNRVSIAMNMPYARRCVQTRLYSVYISPVMPLWGQISYPARLMTRRTCSTCALSEDVESQTPTYVPCSTRLNQQGKHDDLQGQTDKSAVNITERRSHGGPHWHKRPMFECRTAGPQPHALWISHSRGKQPKSFCVPDPTARPCSPR